MAESGDSRVLQTIPLMLIVVLFCHFVHGKVIYVNDDATGSNGGTSWGNAYVYLQDALADANSTEKPVEIWVAQGVYRPDQGANQTLMDPNATFQLINHVILKGGFAGINKIEALARNVETWKTILSGDLNDDDADIAETTQLEAEPTRADNAKHVITGSNSNETAVLDGFIITAGNANGPKLGRCPDIDERLIHGGGMYNVSGTPTLIKCTFSKNYGEKGGGIYNEQSNPTLTDCVFSGNLAHISGGGMYNDESSPALIKCTFAENWAHHGGGMYNYQSNPTLTDCNLNKNMVYRYGGGMSNQLSNPILTNCTFNENSSRYGGGMSNIQSSPILTKCIFQNNHSDFSGGGMANEVVSSQNNHDEVGSTPILTNCEFYDNYTVYLGGGIFNGDSNPSLINCILSRNAAGWSGGGIYNSGSSPMLNNCIISGNKGPLGGGGMTNISASGSPSVKSKPTLTNCIFTGNYSSSRGGALDYRKEPPPTLINCILWGNTPSINTSLFWGPTYSYSDVEKGFIGEGNIDIDPLFADPGYWSDANDLSIVVEPNHPNAVWIDGDYHLKSQAGRWDPVSESWVKDGITSPCIDAGDPNSPIEHEPFPNNGVINMGVYGSTNEASKSIIQAFLPYPQNGDLDVMRQLILSWFAASRAVYHDVYLGEHEEEVAKATTENIGIYRGRQSEEVTTYETSPLEWGKTYYWRIDEVNENDPYSSRKGAVWNFTTTDFVSLVIVDDFESYGASYNDIYIEGALSIRQIWLDRVANGTGSYVDLHSDQQTVSVGRALIVHGGEQSMRIEYDNANPPYYSEVERNWITPQDWTFNDSDALTLYFRSGASNSRDGLYVAIRDISGQIAVVTHLDYDLALTTNWQKWHISLADLNMAGVDVTMIKKLCIGIGDINNPQPGDTGTIYIDDIQVTNRMP